MTWANRLRKQSKILYILEIFSHDIYNFAQTKRIFQKTWRSCNNSFTKNDFMRAHRLTNIWDLIELGNMTKNLKLHHLHFLYFEKKVWIYVSHRQKYAIILTQKGILVERNWQITQKKLQLKKVKTFTIFFQSHWQSKRKKVMGFLKTSRTWRGGG